MIDKYLMHLFLYFKIFCSIYCNRKYIFELTIKHKILVFRFTSIYNSVIKILLF